MHTARFAKAGLTHKLRLIFPKKDICVTDYLTFTGRI